MSEFDREPPLPRESDRWIEAGPTNVQIVYILYLASFIVGITALVGVVIAYMNRSKAEPWLDTHYTWAIRTFWLALLYTLVSVVLMVIGVGFILMIATVVWVVVRSILGLQAVGRREAMKNPRSWLI